MTTDLSKPNLNRQPVRIAVGGENRGRVQNQTIPWGELQKRLSHVVATNEKFIDYKRMSVDKKNNLKNVAGYWIGAHCEDGRRRRSGITERDVMCFDIDNGQLYDGDLLKDLKQGNTGISEYEFLVHSSRSHTVLNPRLRIVFLLKKPVSADAYNAFSRIMAQKLDSAMNTVDHVSFRLAQMMYLPSCSKDMVDDFLYFRNEGEPVDPEEVLEAWPGDWRDVHALPKCPGEEDLRAVAAKAEDPTTKQGIVGEFCRTYDIHEAIAKFLPGDYEETDYEGSEVRYRYRDSAGGAGAVVYGDGLFLYSHHGTDPYSDRLLNAFDLVRLHKFGHMDEDEADNTAVTKLPSYKAMVDLAKSDEAVKKVAIAERYNPEFFKDIREEGEEDAKPVEKKETDAVTSLLGEITDDDLRAMGVDPEAEKPEKNWMLDLEYTEDNVLKVTLSNLLAILTHDPRLKGAFALNEMTGKVVQRRALGARIEGLSTLPPERANGEFLPVQDGAVHWVRALLDGMSLHRGGQGYGLRYSFTDVDAAIKQIGRMNAFHPVKQWIEKTEWDGTPRIDTFFSRHLGCDDNAYTREASRLMFLAGIARLYEPGSKFDYAVILEGVQGAGKSTFIRILANGQWFGELEGDMSDTRQMIERMSGKWIMELPEMTFMRRTEVNAVKSFLSKQDAQVRMAYGRNETNFLWQCIFIGSTNDTNYLKDPTGNRRFWPIRVPEGWKIKFSDVRKEVRQAWAEALSVYNDIKGQRDGFGNVPLYLSPEAEAIAKLEQEDRMSDDHEYDLDRSDSVRRWADRPVPTSAIAAELAMPPEADEYADLEPEMVYRTFLTPEAIWISVFHESAKSYDRKAAMEIARVMRTSTEFEKTKIKAPWGWLRGYSRKSAPKGLWYLTAAEMFGDEEDDALEGLL